MRYIIYICMIIFSGCLSGCQVLNAPNVPETLSAQNTAFVAEATSLPLALQGTAISLARTAVVVETEVAGINSVSRQLIATAKVVVPITPAPQVGAAPILTDGNTKSNSSVTLTNALVDIAVTSRKRDSDGCADGTQSQFAVDTPIIYATTRATSISRGSIVSVEWKYQGEVVGNGSYTLPKDETDFCIWFPLDPANIPFTPGSWSVQFTLNSTVVEPTIFFNIGEAPTPAQ